MQWPFLVLYSTKALCSTPKPAAGYTALVNLNSYLCRSRRSSRQS